MTKVLVTGGAGFIGSHIVDQLVIDGYKVVVIDNLSTGKKENLSSVMDNIVFIEDDIRNLDVVNKSMQGIDFVIHTAALNAVPRSLKEPVNVNDTNIKGTLHVLLAARDNNVQRVIFSSSSSTYGKDRLSIQKETMQAKPSSPYALTKLVGEHYCRIFYELFRLETVCLRYFNVFGPRQDETSGYAAVIPLFISHLLKGESPTIHGDGSQSRDFTYVKNVVCANICALKSSNISPGSVYNIACGDTTSIISLLNKIKSILGSNAQPFFSDRRPGDIDYSRADVQKAVDHLDWHPSISIDEGLARTIMWYKEKVTKELKIPAFD